MNFDPNSIRKLSELDQKEFEKKLGELASAIGIDKKTLSALVGNREQLQKRLAKISGDDIKRMTASADPKTLEKISRALGD